VSNQPNEETFTDCTECGGEPVLGLSAYLLGNIGLCANEGGSQMAWYRPPVSYSGNAAGLRGRLPYLSCANWKTPETFSEAGKAIDNSVNTPISSDGNYQADQVMLGPQCQDDYQLSTGAIFGAWATTDWSCGDSAPGTGASTAIAGTDGSCGTIGFNRIKNGESNSTVYESYLNMTRVNAATGLSDGGMEIPMSLVYQCSEFCTGPGGTSEDDHNKCMNVVALEKATIENDGYTCVETSAAKNALSCTLIDGQQFSVNLTVVASGPGEFDALWGSLEVGQANIQCPSACSQCESGLGGETPGGQSLVDGYCTGFCSGYGFCGGSDYNVPDGPQAPIDCRQCVY
jgi:hypothetical protein